MDQTRELFHQLAGILLWPVIVSLIGLLAYTIVSAGIFCRDWWDRSRGRFRARQSAMRMLDGVDRTAPGYDIRLEQALQESEHAQWRAVNRGRLPIRLGPSLGLMGTLIPMAAALSALATGNLPGLATNMVTAFAATVVGLFISVVAYLISSAREEWARADTREAAFFAEQLLRAFTTQPERLHAVR